LGVALSCPGQFALSLGPGPTASQSFQSQAYFVFARAWPGPLPLQKLTEHKLMCYLTRFRVSYCVLFVETSSPIPFAPKRAFPDIYIRHLSSSIHVFVAIYILRSGCSLPPYQRRMPGSGLVLVPTRPLPSPFYPALPRSFYLVHSGLAWVPGFPPGRLGTAFPPLPDAPCSSFAQGLGSRRLLLGRDSDLERGPTGFFFFVGIFFFWL